MASRSTQPVMAANKSILTTVLTLKGHKHSISSLSYFPDGEQMISGSGDGTARQWDLEAGEEMKEALDVCEQEVRAVAVSRDGRWIVTGGGHFLTGELKVYEVETGIVRSFQGPGMINCIDISADSTLLASGSDNEVVRIWSLDAGKHATGPFKSHDKVGAVRFSQDSKKLAVMSLIGKCLEVWDVQTQKLDGRVGKFVGGLGFIFVPVFWTTKDKTIVAAFSFTDDSPRTIYEFKSSTLKTVGTPFQGHTDSINGLALSFDCALLASTSYDHTIKLWTFKSRELLASFHIQNIPHYILFSPDSRQLAYTTQYDTVIYICNTPPDILASIRPEHPLHRTNAPRNAPLADLLNRVAALLPSLWKHSPTTDSQAPQLPPHPRELVLPAFDMVAVLPVSSDHEYGLEAVTKTPTLPVTPLPHPTRRPFPTINSWIPDLPPHTHELLPSSSHTDAVLPVHNDEPDDLLHDAVLPDLSKYITKDGDYPVARGGFGEIWKCTYHIDHKPIKVAVKALQVYAADQLGAAGTKKIKGIKRELRICASLKHANILSVYGYTYDFGPFIAIVSPWAEKGNLSAYLEREGSALTLVRRFQILRDIIAGLRYLHANRVIHGDFSGPNVLIHGDGTACVADFGLSLMYSEVISASQASWTSTIKGNRRWMAPELLVDREDESQVRPSERSDMYSFGGIMLHVLTNKIPYYYLSNDAAIILCIAKLQTPSRSRYPVLPEKYWRFMEQCWSSDPWDRPSTEGADEAIRNEFFSLSRSD